MWKNKNSPRSPQGDINLIYEGDLYLLSGTGGSFFNSIQLLLRQSEDWVVGWFLITVHIYKCPFKAAYVKGEAQSSLVKIMKTEQFGFTRHWCYQTQDLLPINSQEIKWNQMRLQTVMNWSYSAAESWWLNWYQWFELDLGISIELVLLWVDLIFIYEVICKTWFNRAHRERSRVKDTWSWPVSVSEVTFSRPFCPSSKTMASLICVFIIW